VAVFGVTLGMGARTAWIGTTDVFCFGRGDLWRCNAIVSFKVLTADLYIYEPGQAPRLSAGTGPFFRHSIGVGVVVVGMEPRFDHAAHHDLGVWIWNHYSQAGKPVFSGYQLSLPYLPPLALLVCGGVLAHWMWQRLAERRALRQGHCATCGYDLRAHRPGQRCPECGTVVASDSGGEIPVKREDCG